MDKKHCNGCEDDFYNDNNPYGIKQCWGLKTAKIVTRYRLHKDTPMNQKSGYQKVKTPSCYKKKGYFHLNQIPNYAE